MQRGPVLERDENRCRFWISPDEICGATKNLSLHHVRPRSAGGSGEMANLVTVCRRHHDLIEKYALTRLDQHDRWWDEGRIGNVALNRVTPHKFTLPKAAVRRALLASPRFAGAELHRW